MKGLKITYSVDSESMTNMEYEDQEDRTFSISLERLRHLIESELPLKTGEHVEWQYSDIDIIR
jgi:hypothetical protein